MSRHKTSLVTLDNLIPNIKLYLDLGGIALFGYIPQPPKYGCQKDI